MNVEPSTTEAASLSLLAPRLTLGTTFYGSADLSVQSASVKSLIDIAVDQGLRGFTYYVDWADLDAARGHYMLDEFTATLDRLRRLGVKPFVNITVGDIEAYNLPPELSNGNGGLADGISLDNPDVIERFGQLLDRVAPILVAHGGFFLGIGNEVDARLDGDFATEREAYVRFVEAARERVHAIEPRLAVGVTLTNRAVRERTRTFRALQSVSDVVAFNHAPIRPDFFVMDLDEIQADFREVVAVYGEGPILIQELTCPSPASMGASETWQRACFERLFEEIENTSNVRFASVFTLQDFEEGTCKTVREALLGEELEALPKSVAQRLADYLCYLGVINSDGTPKLAWSAVLAAAAASADKQ